MLQLFNTTNDTINNNTMMKSPINDMSCSQSTEDLSLDDGDNDSGPYHGRPSLVVLADYDSDSLGDLSFEKESTFVQCHRRGGLKRRGSSDIASAHSVTFSQVKIRTFAHCVGDNPAVSLGVPLSLSWKILSEEATTVDAYDPVHPRGMREEDLAIPASEREHVVRRAGYGTLDIRNAVRVVNAVKMEREKTLDTLKSASSEEFMEKVVRGVFNATLRRKSKRMERALLQQLREKDAKRTAAVANAVSQF
jgi:hypothetical protein